MKKTYKFIMPGLAIFAVLNGYIFSASCDLTDYIHNYSTDTEFQMDSNITWDEVNSVTNTGEDYQVLSGVRASTLKQYFTSDDILEGYALGKVSQKRVCTIYCSEPEYFAGLQAVASTYPDYETLYTKAQGKAPSVTTSVPTTTATEITVENEQAKEKNNESQKESTLPEKQDDVVEAEESITGLFVVTVDTVVLDAPKGTKIDTLEKGTEITIAGSSNGYYQFKYNDKTGYILINDETVIPKEEYDKAWAETDRVEPTCTEDGYVTLINSYSQLDKTTSIAATGHDKGEWTTTKKAGLFTKGLAQRLCTKCDEVLEEREVNQIIPTSLLVIIVIGLLAVVGFIGLKIKPKGKV